MTPVIRAQQITAKSVGRSMFVAGSAAMLALAALSFAPHAEARSDVSLSIGFGNVGGGYPVYQQQPMYAPQPIYVQPQPVYVQPQPVYGQPQVIYQPPAPVYYQPRPVYVQPRPVYVQPAPTYYPQPVYYGRPHDDYRGGYGNGYGNGNGNGNGSGNGYRHHGHHRDAAPVYYGR